MPNETELRRVVVEPKVPASAHTKGEYTGDEHLLSVAELAARLDTSLDADNPSASRGLSAAEAAARLERLGPNSLTTKRGIPEWRKFLKELTDPLLLLLLVAGVLCFIAYAIDSSARQSTTNLYLGSVLFGIVFATCIMTYLQGRRTEAVLARIGGLLAAQCLVVRDGAEKRIDASGLVPGDVVRLALGDRVPADLRIIASSDLRTDKSGITGESTPVRASDTPDKPGTLALNALSIAFNSSLVVAGEGTGVVTRTGNATMIGSIASLAAGTAGAGATLLQREVKRFVEFIAIVAIVTGVCFFIIGISRAASLHHGKVPRPVFVNVFVNGLILVIVANIPEGLPATVTSCLSITARRMAQRHVVIKRLDIIETLGSATVICTDKTGTLTENRMSVEHLWYSRHSFHAASAKGMHQREQRAGGAVPALPPTDGQDQDAEEVAPDVQQSLAAEATAGQDTDWDGAATTTGGAMSTFTVSGPAAAALARRRRGTPPWRDFSPHAKLLAISALCNRARPANPPSSVPGHGAAEKAITGGAADAALFRYAEMFFAVASARAQFPRVHDVPFSSAAKFAAVVTTDRADPGGRHLVMLKGAPEIILARCATYIFGREERPIDDAFCEHFTHTYERFGAMGERVLGFAYAYAPPVSPQVYAREPERIPASGCVFVGLISLVDPPRQGVAEAIAMCRGAGIKVTMVTGDHPLTAEAIARKVGIISRPTRHDVAAALGIAEAEVPLSDERVEAVVVTGEQLHSLHTDADWDALLSKHEVVLARTSPQQKLTLVENYQRRGEVVAVTGDGVNDSPALKRAQVGVAMGSPAASDVAREAADIVLLDDNFASIVAAIEEGRTLFDNLKKTIAYTLAHAVPELTPALLNLAFGFPLPLNGLLILTIDMLTEQGPAISLAFERAERAVMLAPPRRLHKDNLVTARSLLYSYVIAGFAEAAVCFFAYCLAFTRHGVSIHELAFSTDKHAFWSAPSGDGSAFQAAPSPLDARRLASNATYAAELAPKRALPRAYAAAHDGAPVFPPLWVTSDGRVYDAPAQWRIYRESQAAWYLTLIMCQFWHIWNCRTRVESIFRHGLFSNVVTVYGALSAIFVACFVVYLPPFHRPNAFQTTALSALLWVPHFVFGAYIFTYNEAVKWAVRHRPRSWAARRLGW